MSIDEVEEDTYPGSTRRKRSAGGEGPKIPDTEPQPWEEMFELRLYEGKQMRFYPISALASALGRSVATVRHWDENSILPPASLRTDALGPQGRRRVYTHAQIAGLQRIAEHEGLFRSNRVYVRRTKFTAQAFALFKALEVGE